MRLRNEDGHNMPMTRSKHSIQQQHFQSHVHTCHFSAWWILLLILKFETWNSGFRIFCREQKAGSKIAKCVCLLHFWSLRQSNSWHMFLIQVWTLFCVEAWLLYIIYFACDHGLGCPRPQVLFRFFHNLNVAGIFTHPNFTHSTHPNLSERKTKTICTYC